MKKMLKNIFCLVLAFILGLWLVPSMVQASNLFSSQPQDAAARSKVILVAVDLSNSTKPAREDYIRYFRMILDSLNGGDTLMLTKIIKHPSESASLTGQLTLKSAGIMDNRTKVREQNLIDSIKLLQTFESLVKDTEENETPIIEVTENARQILENTQQSRKIIVYLSDMMEYSTTTANFEAKKSVFDNAAVPKVLDKLVKNKRIANLLGVTIYVAGARDANPVRKEAVKTFWKEYFQRAGAQLDPNNYGSDLIAFNECNKPGTCGSFFTDGKDLKLRSKMVH